MIMSLKKLRTMLQCLKTIQIRHLSLVLICFYKFKDKGEGFRT